MDKISRLLLILLPYYETVLPLSISEVKLRQKLMMMTETGLQTERKFFWQNIRKYKVSFVGDEIEIIGGPTGSGEPEIVLLAQGKIESTLYGVKLNLKLRLPKVVIIAGLLMSSFYCYFSVVYGQSSVIAVLAQITILYFVLVVIFRSEARKFTELLTKTLNLD